MVERVTISMDEELYEKITDELEYGDSMSEWMREAVQTRLCEEGERGNAKGKMGGMTAD